MKKSLRTTILATILTLTTITLILPITNAHTPAWEITSYAFIEASPDPVGVNQLVYILMWVDWPLPGANMNNEVRRANYTLTITKPDQTIETQEWPTISDSTGIVFYAYTPDQTGTYTLNFDYGGQIYTWSDGRQQKTWTNDVFLPASASTTITVQEDPIPNPITSYPMPTEYWTRPIEGQNTDWWRISSHWLGDPQIQSEPNGRYQMDGIAPNSAHIMWTKPYEMGGIVGGTKHGPIDGDMFYTGANYDVSIENPLIMYGMFYYPLPLGGSDSGGGYMCVDLRTGEEIWYQDIPTQSFGQILYYSNPNQHGVVNGVLWYGGGRRSTSWNATDPWTGRALYNLTDVPSGTSVYGPNGEILQYMLDSDGDWLALWNTTVALGSMDQTSGEVNASAAYSWNITIPDLPEGDWSIARVFYNDVIVCLQGNLGGRTSRGAVIEALGGNITVISINESTMGQILWTKYYPAPEEVFRDLTSIDTSNRVFIFRDKETMNLWGYSLDTGNYLWGPIKQSDSDWDYFHASSYTYAIYDNLYTAGMDGVIECRDITTGDLKWTYGNGGEGNSTNSGLQTPFGNYPLNVGAFADGKIYTFCFEHTADSPIYKGYTVRCIDAYTGEELWQIDSFVPAGGGGQRGILHPSLAIADGYLVYLNGYDMQLYCIGKGPSELTVETPLTAVPNGSSVMITGTITDQSPGSKAKGTPCISDEDMGEWMEYLFMQKPRPQDATGVPVKLAYQLPDGTWKDIDQTISDDHGNFGFKWTPPEEGTYLIKAFFLGSESYWGSSDTTYVAVDPALDFPDVPTAEEIAADAAQRTINMLPPYPNVPTQEQIAADAAQRTIAMLPQYPTPYPPAEIPAYQTIDLAIIVLLVVGIVIGIYLIIKKK